MSKFFKKHPIISILVIMWVIGFAVMVSNGDADKLFSRSRVSSDPVYTGNEPLEVVGDIKCVTSDYTTTVSGIVQNTNTKSTYRTVTISFSIFDSQGNKIGTATDMISGLEPQQTWKFKAVAWCQGYSWRLDSLRGSF